MFEQIVTVVGADEAVTAMGNERLQKFNDDVKWYVDSSFDCVL